MPAKRTKSSEAKLLLRAMKGDKQAFGMLYENYLNEIYRYIYYRVADQIEAEDLTEMVFLKVWEKLPRITKDSAIQNFRAWIYRIAHNLVVDRHRATKPTLSLDQINSLQDAGPTPEAIVHRREKAQQLAQLISELDPRLQQVVTCRFISQWSHAQTAQVMGLSEGHVRVLQHRALKRMQKMILDDSVPVKDIIYDG